MGHTDSHAIKAIALRIESRKEAEQASAESDVERIKAQWLRNLTASDLGENIGGDWMTAAIRIGDAALIGQICLMALDQYTERLAVQDVYGLDRVEFKDEAMAEKLVSDFIKARAGVTQ